MKRRSILAAAGAAAALAAGAGGALAAGGPGGPGPHGGPAGSPAVATYLGLTPAELRTQLEAGRSPAEIATAQGKTVAGLKAAILAEAKTHLDAEVAAGRLTADRAKTMLDRLSSHLDDLAERTGPPPGRP